MCFLTDSIYLNIYLFNHLKKHTNIKLIDEKAKIIKLFQYTGARLGEICQLHLSDIKKVEGNWGFDINDVDDMQHIKRTKNKKSSKRVIPIKSNLIKFRLLDYVEILNESNQTLLFPEEKRNESGKFDAISKRFNNKLKDLKQSR